MFASFKGWGVILSLGAWFAFSTSIIFSNRQILVEQGFHFPLTLTGWHLTFATIATRTLAHCTPYLDGVQAVNSRMTWEIWSWTVVPVGLLFSASLACANYACKFKVPSMELQGVNTENESLNFLS